MEEEDRMATHAHGAEDLDHETFPPGHICQMTSPTEEPGLDGTVGGEVALSFFFPPPGNMLEQE